MQRHGEHDALRVVPVARHEEGVAHQAGMLPDLGHVLVLQVQAVELEGRCACGRRALVALDAGTALAAVA